MLADFFDRAAVAASQIVAGFRRDEFAQLLLGKSIGIAFADGDPHTRQMVDLAVRLAARLYPTLSLQPGRKARALAREYVELARSINPRIDVAVDRRADIGLVVGNAAAQLVMPIHVGCSDWEAFVDIDEPQPVRSGHLPFGAGVAAAVGMANVFRGVLGIDEFDRGLKYRVLNVDAAMKGIDPTHPVPSEVVLVGCGAIGSAAVWALRYLSGSRVIHLVDHERLELSNLQRYVLSARRDVGRYKVDVVAEQLSHLTPKRHRETWGRFVGRFGHTWPAVLVAVDSADARCEIQASLPRRIANAWTQPGDLGVSVHGRFGNEGACLACLYLRDTPTKNDDQIVADALGIPERLMDVRNLLQLGLPVPDPLLALIAARIGHDVKDLEPYSGLPLRRLYVEGICGGALVTPNPARGVTAELHVPLAHQSALAGVLLAASLASGRMAQPSPGTTDITRVDVLRPIGAVTTQPAAARHDGRCLCDDADFRAVYDAKWSGQVDRPLSLRKREATSRCG